MLSVSCLVYGQCVGFRDFSGVVDEQPRLLHGVTRHASKIAFADADFAQTGFKTEPDIERGQFLRRTVPRYPGPRCRLPGEGTRTGQAQHRAEPQPVH